MGENSTEVQIISRSNNIVSVDRERSSFVANKETSTALLQGEVCSTLMQQFDEISERLDSLQLTVNSLQRRMGERLETTNVDVHHGKDVSNSAILISNGPAMDHRVDTLQFQKSSNGNCGAHWV